MPPKKGKKGKKSKKGKKRGAKCSQKPDHHIYRVKSKNGKERNRCLSDMCKRSKNIPLPRDTDGKCPNLVDVYGDDYNRYKRTKK